MMMNAWKDREGSLANAELEDGEVEHGLRRNVVSAKRPGLAVPFADRHLQKANIFRVI